MVDTTEASESNYVTIDLINESPTKEFVVIHAGEYEETLYGKRLTIEIEIDKKRKKYSPNQDSVKNLQAEWGTESENWMNKHGKFITAKMGGKDRIYATPKT